MASVRAPVYPPLILLAVTLNNLPRLFSCYIIRNRFKVGKIYSRDEENFPVTQFCVTELTVTLANSCPIQPNLKSHQWDTLYRLRYTEHTVAYLLHARIAEPQKSRNTVHYATIDEEVFSPCRAEPHRACCYATLR
jgi:hypothetical protein